MAVCGTAIRLRARLKRSAQKLPAAASHYDASCRSESNVDSEIAMYAYALAARAGRTTRRSGVYEVLVIEDEPDIAELIGLHMQDLPGRAEIIADGAAGLDAASSGRYDLVVLDLRLPHLDGLEICRRLRLQGSRIPILVVTARASDSERIVGLELGADDYLPKPFNTAELVARARALLRRSEMRRAAEESPRPLRRGDIYIDPAGRQARVGGREISLTPREFDLFFTLAREPGRVFSKAELLRSVWGLPFEGYEHSLTCQINRLRHKIEKDPGQPRRLLTVWGVGYKLAD